ncbi:MAG: hypothetical protein NTW86_03220 [Candidatus Sumerlaeota bacterium]|nr:hypothetical protein [Candidatus Sumerlaeota bacterium]
MTYFGHVRNNVIVLDAGATLPDGTEVRIEPVTPGDAVGGGVSLLDRLGELVGSVPGLPDDLAENHDHYIHGTAKR